VRRAAALGLALAFLAPAAARAQRPIQTARLEIATVGDSTITIRRAGVDWLRPEYRGIVVDPRRRDALVARFRVLSVAGDSAVALLTGLTSPVVADHVALVDPPRRRWFAQGLFWAGTLIGAAVGAAVAASF
jgi:hypothetical protein